MVEDQFASARASVAAANLSAQQARQRLEAQRQSLSERQRQLTSQATIRNADINQRVQQRQALNSLDREYRNLQQQDRQVSDYEARVGLVKKQLADAEDEYRKLQPRKTGGVGGGGSSKPVSSPQSVVIVPGGRSEVPQAPTLQSQVPVSYQVDSINNPAGFSSVPEKLPTQSIVPQSYNDQIAQRNVAVVTIPSQGERFRGYIREKTGVSVPSFRQSFNYFTRGAEPGSIESTQKIGVSRVVYSPIALGYRAREVLSKDIVQGGLQYLGYEGINNPDTSNLGNIPQKVSVGADNVASRFQRGNDKIITPREIGFATGLGFDYLTFKTVNPNVIGVGFLASGTEKSLDKSKSGTERLFGLGEAVIGASILSSQATNTLFKDRIISREPVPEPKIGTDDFIQPYIKSGRQFEQGQFNQFGRTEPRYGQVQSYYERFIGRAPRNVELAAAQERNAFGNIITREGEILRGNMATRRVGASLTNVYSLSGAQEDVLLNRVSSLTPVERSIAEDLLGKVPRALPNEFSATRGEIIANRLFRFSKSNPETIIRPSAGTATSRSATFSVNMPSSVQLEGRQQILSVTGSRDITLPGRFGKKTTSVFGETVINEPKSLDNIDDLYFRKVFPGQEKVVQETANIQKATANLKGAEAKSAEILRGEMKSSIYSETARTIGKLTQDRPSAISDLGKPTGSALSKFAGTGQYERTETTSFGIPSSPNMNRELLSVKTSQINVPIPATSMGQGESVSLTNRQREILRNLSRELQAQNQDNILRSAQSQSQSQSQISRLLQSIAQQSSSSASRSSSEANRRPVITPVDISLGSRKRGKSFSITNIPIVKDAFDVFIKRKGKKIKVAEGLPEGRAEAFGQDIDIDTLARSYRLERRGTTTIEDIPRRGLGEIFRPSKREQGTFVQKAKYSLSSPAELLEIKAARRRSKSII